MFKGVKKYYLNNINWIDAFPNPEKYMIMKKIKSKLIIYLDWLIIATSIITMILTFIFQNYY